MSSYVSKVPQFTFPATLAEQEAALAENPLLQRLNEYRKRYAGDPFRPQYHYVNPEHMLNDPNGLCFWQGRWHLFYQAYPPEDPRQHWGHAVSDDLIHWRDLPYAIYPDPEECCFSGATLVEDDRVIAMYHGTQVGNMIAVSSDPLLLNWEKVSGGPVIPFAKPDEPATPYRVFDPCIWKRGELYYSLSAGTTPTGPDGRHVAADFLFRSADLEHWEYLHPLTEDDRYSIVGDDGACPYFWPIGDKHILLFFSHMSGGQYLIGDYDTQRDKLVVTGGGKFNHGPATPSGVHAPSATPRPDGSVTVIFNMNPGKPTEGWNQIMTLPMRLRLAGGSRLTMEPDGDIESLRGAHLQVGTTPLPANQEVVLEQVAGNAMELQLEVDTQDAPVVTIDVLRSPDRAEYTRLSLYRERGFRHRFDADEWRGKRFGDHRPGRWQHPGPESLVTLDNSFSSLAADVRPRAPETAHVLVAEGEPFRLRIFIDHSVVEVYVNGRQYLAERVYPSREDSVGVALRAQGADAELRGLDAWQMADIYAG